MKNLRQPPKYDKGIGRFRGEASLSSREFSLRLGHLTALTLLASFTPVRSLCYVYKYVEA